MKRYLLELLLAAAAIFMAFGCGGGGGGGGPTANVRGRIMLVGTSQPLAGATVNIAGQSVVTTATGEFQFAGVPVLPSPQIQVSAPGIATLNQSVPALTANQANDLGDIFVVDENGTYTANVRGTVVNAENFNPVANAVVTISGRRATTGANGEFQLTNLPVGLGGSIAVGTITAQGFETKSLILDLPLGASPPDNDLGPIAISPPVGTIPGGPFNIRGTVTQVGIQDMTGTIVSLIRKSDNQVVDTFTTGAAGFYGFWVVAGEYTVRAERGAGAVKTADATLVRIDQPITVNLTIGGP